MLPSIWAVKFFSSNQADPELGGIFVPLLHPLETPETPGHPVLAGLGAPALLESPQRSWPIGVRLFDELEEGRLPQPPSILEAVGSLEPKLQVVDVNPRLFSTEVVELDESEGFSPC